MNIVPLRVLYDEDTQNPSGVAELQQGETIPEKHGGTGVTSLQALQDKIGLKDLAYTNQADLNLKQLAHMTVDDLLLQELAFVTSTSLNNEYGFYKESDVTKYLVANNYINQFATNRLIEIEFVKHLSLIAKKSDTLKFEITTPRKVWRVPHNRGTQFFEQELFSRDSYGSLSPFQAKKVIIDDNTVEFIMSKEMSGYILMTFHDSIYEKCLADRINEIVASSCPSTNTFISGIDTNAEGCNSFVFNQDTLSDVWVIEREPDSRQISVFVHDDRETIYNVTPQSVADNLITIKFTEPRSGRAIVYYDDYLYNTGPKFQEISRFVFNERQLVWRIEHNLRSLHVECELYAPDDYGNSPFFAKQFIVDENTIEYRFSKPMKGYVNIVFSDIGNKITTISL